MGELTVRGIREDETSDVGHLVAQAFVHEETSARLLPLERPEVRARYGVLMSMATERYLAEGAPVLGAYLDDELVGAALGNYSSGHAPQRMSFGTGARMWAETIELFARTRPSAWGLWWAFRAPRSLPKPYILLDALAVSETARGAGVGRALLEAFQAQSCCLPGITGIYLITAGERPRRIYEKAGFRVVDEQRSAGLTLAHMFKEC